MVVASAIEMSTGDSIVDAVIQQFADRSRVGQVKYGQTLDRSDLTVHDWIQHAQEELMDGILYLEKLKQVTTRTLCRSDETVVGRNTLVEPTGTPHIDPSSTV